MKSDPYETPSSEPADDSPLVRAMNQLTDMDSGWWPFLRLRPPKTERLTTQRVALMSIAYGSFYASILALFFLWKGRLVVSRLPLLFGCFIVFFFLAYRFTFAIAWNMRAKRLAAGGSR